MYREVEALLRCIPGTKTRLCVNYTQMKKKKKLRRKRKQAVRNMAFSLEGRLGPEIDNCNHTDGLGSHWNG